MLTRQQWIEIQEALLTLGCDVGGEITLSGEPDEMTTLALEEFQSRVPNLDVTGTLDRDTLVELLEQVPALFPEVLSGDVEAFLDTVFPEELVVAVGNALRVPPADPQATVDADVTLEPGDGSDDDVATTVTSDDAEGDA
jgi:hypothetical protein